MTGRKSAVQESSIQSTRLKDVKIVGSLYTPGCPLMTPLRQMKALHCVITGLYLSSICNKTALLFHENNKFDTVKETNIEEDSTKQLVEKQ